MADVKLDLGKKDLNPALKDMVKMLNLNHSLLRLDLSESSIEPIGLKALSSGIKMSCSIRTLSLRANPLCNVNSFAWGRFDVSGFEAFTDALRMSVSLNSSTLVNASLWVNKNGEETTMPWHSYISSALNGINSPATRFE